MRLKNYILFLFIIGVGFITWSFTAGKERSPAKEHARSLLNKSSAQLYKQALAFKSSATQRQSVSSLKKSYREMRKTYKRAEALIEYFLPALAHAVNGSAIAEADDDEGSKNIIEPEGLQVIEQNVFSDSLNYELLLRQSNQLAVSCSTLCVAAAKLEMEDWQLPDAMKQETIRIMCLNITGFDSPASGDAIAETPFAIEGVENILEGCKGLCAQKAFVIKLQEELKSAKKYAADHSNFKTFDRMEFIRTFLNPVYAGEVDFILNSNIRNVELPYLINAKSKTLFSNEAFNAFYFSPPYSTGYTNKEAAAKLGRKLFYDVLLSSNMNRSCATCHKPEKGFTDGLHTAAGLDNKPLMRNTPTLLNVAFQSYQFWDARVVYLEEQVNGVTLNGAELHGNFDTAVVRLKNREDYRKLFKQAFSGTEDSSITKEGILSSIATYERSLVSMNSVFDKYIRGESNTMSKEDINGFNLFMGKANCGTCHYMPLFNGTAPPQFTHTDWEILGTPATKDNKILDTDMGRYETTNLELHKNAFKTPTLRNINITGPYMHNGVYDSLEQVMNFYNKGGGAGLKYNVPYQTLSSDSLGLTKKEVNDIILFLKTLTDTSGINPEEKN